MMMRDTGRIHFPLEIMLFIFLGLGLLHSVLQIPFRLGLELSEGSHTAYASDAAPAQDSALVEREGALINGSDEAMYHRQVGQNQLLPDVATFMSINNNNEERFYTSSDLQLDRVPVRDDLKSMQMKEVYSSENEGAIVTGTSHDAYLLQSGQRHLISDTTTYGAIFDSNGRRSYEWSDESLNRIPLGREAFVERESDNLPGEGIRQGYQLPMRGKVQIMGYGPGQGDHRSRDYWAVDLISDRSQIYPIAPGKVVYAAYNLQRANASQPTAYGNVVTVDHGQGLYSIYAHLGEKGLPAVGAQVSWDTPIGLMSDSGCFGKSSAHLHFAIHKGSPGLSGENSLWLANAPVNAREVVAGLSVLWAGRS